MPVITHRYWQNTLEREEKLAIRSRSNTRINPEESSSKLSFWLNMRLL